MFFREENIEQSAYLVTITPAIWKSIMQFFITAITEEQLQEGQVGKGDIALILWSWLPGFYGFDEPMLNYNSQSTTIKTDLDLAAVAGRNRLRQSFFKHRPDVV